MSDRWRIVLVAETRTAFHTLGPGRTVHLVERPIQVDPEGAPFIPASSVRGRVRAHLERLLRALGQPVCRPPRPEGMCPHAGVVADPAGPLCLACRIFGNAWHPSATSFEDLHLVRPGPEPVPLSYRTGTGISRWLGTVQTGRLFTVETTTGGGLRFQGGVEGLLSREEVGWLLAAVGTVRHLGGGKARGLGEVRLRVAHLFRWDPQVGAWVEEDPENLVKEVVGDAPDQSRP